MKDWELALVMYNENNYPFLRLYYNDNVIRQDWIGFSTQTEFKLGIDQTFKCLKYYNAAILIINTEDSTSVGKTCREYAANELLKYVENEFSISGLDNYIFTQIIIIPTELLLSIDINGFSKKVNNNQLSQHINTILVKDLEEAYDIINTSKNKIN